MAAYTKRVNVRPTIPVIINGTRIARQLIDVELSYSTILTCLRFKAKVEEICKDGRIVKLSFTNYNKNNDTSVVAEEEIPTTPVEDPIIPPAVDPVEESVEDPINENESTVITDSEESTDAEDNTEDEESVEDSAEEIPTSNIRKNKKRR